MRHNGSCRAQDKSIYFNAAKCEHCKETSAWINGLMYVPSGGNAPVPHEDMPDSVLAVYQEAANVSQFSPRAAIALFRLALENLVHELGAEGRDINAQIGDLVRKGLSPLIQQSLDSLRVIGNEAVHIGTVDVTNSQTCSSLFGLLNVIVEQMITVPKNIGSVYAMLPQSKVDGIQKRDGVAGSAEGG